MVKNNIIYRFGLGTPQGLLNGYSSEIGRSDPENPPLNAPTGVRAAPAMTTSFIEYFPIVNTGYRAAADAYSPDEGAVLLQCSETG